MCTGAGAPGSACDDALVATLRAIDPEQIAAIIVEPVNGRSGVPLPRHYLEALRDFCTTNDVVMIYDEVFSGFGRMGTLFAAEIAGVSPDLLCLAKGMTAGYAALGAVLAREHIYAAFDTSPTSYFAHASSTDGHPVACAAGLATLRVFGQEDVVARGRRMGARLRDALAAALAGTASFRRAYATGAFVGVDLVSSTGQPVSMTMKRFIEGVCASRRVLVDYTPDAVMLIPPLTLADDEVEILAETLAGVIGDVREDDVAAAIEAERLRPPSLRGHR
jgi:adenosylmethionine-8-amino-7-oxononanoate aminotransferase